MLRLSNNISSFFFLSGPGTLRRMMLLTSILCSMVFAANPLSAQIDTGGITGTVTDSSGAIVPGAIITLTNDATGVILSTKSTSTGTYSLTAIRPGPYTLRGEAPGFEAFVDNGLEVHLQSTLTIDIPFTAGSVKQEVTVSAAAPLLQAENAAVGQTITSQTVNDLPLNGRNWTSLPQLAAGTSTAPVANPSGNSGSTDSAYFSVDGVNLWQNDFRLNGINDNIEIYGGSSVGSNAAIIPPPDAIQEFKLQNGNFNAEFGHSTGGVINAAIKSGTNRLHGDVWEYFRNTDLDANIFFKATPTSPVPAYHQNQFGATLGGPVYIPKIYNGKDRTFFFVDYQGDRLVTPAPATSTVPTQNMINSGFTNLQDLITYSGGTGTDVLGRTFSHGTILDPATTRPVVQGVMDPVTGLIATATGYVRVPFYTGSLVGKTNFVGATGQLNVIPVGRIDPNAVHILQLYPVPIYSGLANNFAWTPSQDETDNSWDIRIDETINQKNTLFGVYDRSLITRSVPSSLPGLAVGETGGRNDSFPAYAWAVGYNVAFTPSLANEMHVGMVHADKFQRSIYGNTFGIPAQYGIGGVPQVPNNGGIPPITISGLTHIGVGNFTPTIQTVYSIEGSDSVTKVLRGHTFKTGIQVDDLVANISQPPQGRGNYTFNGQYSDIPNKNNSLNGIGDMLLVPVASTVPNGINNVGGLSSFGGSNIAATDDHRWYIGAYFQDDWKVTPNLTLNLGLRWDYFTPYAEVSGRQANFIPNGGGNGNTGTYYISNQGCQVPRSTSFNALLTSSNITLDCVSGLTLGQAQKLNFAPRVGFAYRATPKLVVRGGYGPAYGALGNLGYGGTLGTNYPFVYTSTFNSPDSQHPLLVPGTSQTATLENSLAIINIGDPTVNIGTGLNLYGRQYNFQTPYIQTVNFTVQDQFTNNDSIQIGYVGTMGRHLDNLGYNNSPSQLLPPSANPQNYVPFPSFARNATYETTNATSSYNALQTTYEHQSRYGLTVLANYTWSKCLTDQHTQAGQNQQYRAEWLPGFGITRDYALCDTDATNVFHLSGSWQLPVGRGKMLLSDANRVVDAFLGGWAVNGIYAYQSGQPFTINCPVTTAAGLGCFANVVPGQGLYAGPHNHTQWLNPNAFAQPALATAIGQTDYSVLGGGGQQARGPSFSNLDSSVFKYFNFTETVRLQFRAEFFNTFNHPQFGQPGNLNFTTPVGFSSITSTRNNPRLIQLALKLFF